MRDNCPHWTKFYVSKLVQYNQPPKQLKANSRFSWHKILYLWMRKKGFPFCQKRERLISCLIAKMRTFFFFFKNRKMKMLWKTWPVANYEKLSLKKFPCNSSLLKNIKILFLHFQTCKHLNNWKQSKKELFFISFPKWK